MACRQPAVRAPTAHRGDSLSQDPEKAARPAAWRWRENRGIGKTRFLRALRERDERRSLLVFSGSAAEFERDMPCGVWVDALDAFVDSQDLRCYEQVDDVLLHELAAVLPSVRRGVNGIAHFADERDRVHRAVRVLLELIAAEKALVVVLDDLHRADPGSI